MNRYAELKQRQQKEFNAFPMQYAFSDRQFAEGMAALGLTPADTDKIYKAPGGGFYRREDSQRLKDMLDRFDRELAEAIAADETGEGFIYEMFRYELDNHEYGYTRDTEETLDALGYTADEILNDPRLKRGIEKAVTEICGRKKATPNSKLMTPLFINSNFNRDGRRMRAVHGKTVSNGTDTYRLWHSAGKPDLHYANAENDKYYLYVEVNGYLAPLGITEYVLISQSGTMAVDEQYGGREARKQHFDNLRETEGTDAFFAALDAERTEIERLGGGPVRQADYIRKCLDNRVQTYLKAKENGGETFPDFVGALVMNDLSRCVELSAAHQAMWREEQQARAARDAEEEKAFCEEQNRIAEQTVSDAIQVIRDGGVLKNDPVKFYRSKDNASSCSIVLYLMRQYHVDVPLRTQGWINDKLVSATIRDGRCVQVQYLRSKKNRCSVTFFNCMYKLIRAVAETPQPAIVEQGLQT